MILETINHARMLAAKEEFLVYRGDPLHLITSSYMWKQVVKVNIKEVKTERTRLFCQTSYFPFSINSGPFHAKF